jgi:hypothetical protein
VVEPLRFGILLLALRYVCVAVTSFSWSSALLAKAGAYLGVMLLTSVGGIIAYYWVKHVSPLRGTVPVYALVGVGVLLLYYVTVSAYVFESWR